MHEGSASGSIGAQGGLTVYGRLLAVLALGQKLEPANGVREAAQRVDIRVQRRGVLDLRAGQLEELAEEVLSGLAWGGRACARGDVDELEVENVLEREPEALGEREFERVNTAVPEDLGERGARGE